MKNNEKSIIELIHHNAALSVSEISKRLNMDEKEVKQTLTSLQEQGIIVGYETIINWDKTDKDIVSAFIEVKVVPQQSYGFDSIAKQIYQYPEVDSIYLM